MSASIWNPGPVPASILMDGGTFTGLVNFKVGDPIASATTVDLSTATGNIVHISGTTATSALTMAAGQWVRVVADAAWPLTYHATTNRLNGGVSVTLATGDTVDYFYDGTTVFGVVNATAADPTLVHTSDIGVSVQAYDATLAAVAALTLTQGALVTATGADAPAVLAKGTTLQQLRMNAGATAPEWFTDTAAHTLAAPQAATSGTAIDFTGIPAGVKRITVLGVAVSLSGTDTIIVQLGDSGGFETSGYSGGYSVAATPAASATGFAVQDPTAANAYNFKLTIDLESASGFTWVATGISQDTVAAQSPRLTNGVKSLTAELTQLRVTSTGASTFDAGALNISYES